MGSTAVNKTDKYERIGGLLNEAQNLCGASIVDSLTRGHGLEKASVLGISDLCWHKVVISVMRW